MCITIGDRYGRVSLLAQCVRVLERNLDGLFQVVGIVYFDTGNSVPETKAVMNVLAIPGGVHPDGWDAKSGGLVAAGTVVDHVAARYLQALPQVGLEADTELVPPGFEV